MKRWPIKPLGEFVEEQTERLRQEITTIYSVTNERGFVRSLDLFDKQVFSADTGNYKRVGFHDLAYNPSRINVGSVAMLEDKNGGAVSPMYVIVRCKTGILPAYLLRFLKSDAGLNQIRQRCEGAVRFQLKFRDLCAIPILVPPLAEQERIVKLLDEADELRKLRAQADNRTANLIPALFNEMFGDPAANPKQWPVKKLRDLSVKFSDGPFGSNLKTSHYVESGVRVIRLSNIGVGVLIDDSKAYVSPEHFESLIKHKCLPGDVLVGTLGDPNLRAFILPPEIKMALNKSDCVQIRPNVEVAVGEFICWLLNLPSTLEMASGMIMGQTRSRISMGRLAELRVPVPPLPLQKEFAQRVTEIRELEAAQAASRQRLEALFQSLLHRAFNGDL